MHRYSHQCIPALSEVTAHTYTHTNKQAKSSMALFLGSRWHEARAEQARAEAEAASTSTPQLLEAFWGACVKYSGPYRGESGTLELLHATTAAPDVSAVSQHVSVEMVHWDEYQSANSGCVHGGHAADPPLNEGLLRPVERVCPYVLERFPEPAGMGGCGPRVGPTKVSVGDIVLVTVGSAEEERAESGATVWATNAGVVMNTSPAGLPAPTPMCVTGFKLLLGTDIRMLAGSDRRVEYPAPSVKDLTDRTPAALAALDDMLSHELWHRPFVGLSCTHERERPLVAKAWGGGVWRLEQGESAVVVGVNGFGEARMRKEDGSESTWLAYYGTPDVPLRNPTLDVPRAVSSGLLPAAVSIGGALPDVRGAARRQLLLALSRVVTAPGFPVDIQATEFTAIVSGLAAVQEWAVRDSTTRDALCDILLHLCVRTDTAGALDMCLRAGLLRFMETGIDAAGTVLHWIATTLALSSASAWRPDALSVGADMVTPLVHALRPALRATDFESRAVLHACRRSSVTVHCGGATAGKLCGIWLELAFLMSSKWRSTSPQTFPLLQTRCILEDLELERLVAGRQSELELSGTVNLVSLMLNQMCRAKRPSGVLDVDSMYQRVLQATEEAAGRPRGAATEMRALLLCAGRDTAKFGDRRELWMQVGEFVPGGALPWLWSASRLLYFLQALLNIAGPEVSYRTREGVRDRAEFQSSIFGLVARSVRGHSKVLRMTGLACFAACSRSDRPTPEAFATFCGLLPPNLGLDDLTAYLSALGHFCADWPEDGPSPVCRFVSVPEEEADQRSVDPKARAAAEAVLQGTRVHWGGNGLYFHSSTGPGAVRFDSWEGVDEGMLAASLGHVRRRVLAVGAESNLLSGRVAVGGREPVLSQLVLEVHQFCERKGGDAAAAVLGWVTDRNAAALGATALSEPELRLFLPLVRVGLSRWREADGPGCTVCAAAFATLATCHVHVNDDAATTHFMATERWEAVTVEALSETVSAVSRFAAQLAEAAERSEAVKQETGVLAAVQEEEGEEERSRLAWVAATALEFLLGVSCVEAAGSSGQRRWHPAHVRGIGEADFKDMYGAEEWEKAQPSTDVYPAERCVAAVRGALRELLPVLARLPGRARSSDSASSVKSDSQRAAMIGALVIMRCAAAYPDLLKECAVDVVRPLVLWITRVRELEGGANSSMCHIVASAIGCVLDLVPVAGALDLCPVEVSSDELASCSGGDFSVFVQSEHTGTLTEVSLPADAAVGELRRRAAALLGTAKGRLELIYQGKKLTDYVALADSGLSAQSVVQTHVDVECHVWMPGVITHLLSQRSLDLGCLDLVGAPVAVPNFAHWNLLLQPWRSVSGFVRTLSMFGSDSFSKHLVSWRVCAVSDLVERAQHAPGLAPAVPSDVEECAENVKRLWAETSCGQAAAFTFGSTMGTPSRRSILRASTRRAPPTATAGAPSAGQQSNCKQQ
eukprot:TRINITY_DN2807_c1_g1_i4.p1 TRINITY_DN2807_c1_g1~~TRINITY_DN2807_c1_g1_i4.p1  ORF type:complete len:1455 (+),score=381.98 TRINITY_DN2807_c1_g1_i4:236-4600(+)